MPNYTPGFGELGLPGSNYPSTCRHLAATSLSMVFGDRCRDDMHGGSCQ